MANDVSLVERASVQEHQPPDSGAFFLWDSVPAMASGDLLPPYGRHVRDRALRNLYRGAYAWIAQAAVAALVKRVKQTPWQIEAGPNLRHYYQDVLANADFEDGWGQFISRVLLDYLTCDYGAYIEIIGRGRPDGPLRGRVLGLAHLDSLRCIPTGNVEHPVVYWSRGTDPRKNQRGVMHKLHHSRVIRLVDMPDGDERLFGPGLCALSRAISVLAMQDPMQRYVVGMLDDMPATGVFYNRGGMTFDQFKEAYQEYSLRRRNGYKGPMVISDTRPDIGGEFVPFAAAPANFDFVSYVELAVNAFAAAFGIDRQDIWPLTGKMAGTATQSAVMAEKARGMGFGDILQMLERGINWKVLPPAAEFKFAYEDIDADQQQATRLQTIVSVANGLRQDMSAQEIRRFLAAQSDELRDILTDENGDIVELPDDDPRPETGTVTDEEPVDADPDTLSEDENAARGDKAVKQIQAVRLDFENAFEDVLDSMRHKDISKRRAGTLLRGLIQRYGTRAYTEGLMDGGVADGQMDDEDRTRVALLLSDQSAYVRAFVNTLYDKEVALTDAVAAHKPAQWYGGSIQPFYDAGRLSADRNGNYECTGPADDQSCDTCAAAAGQVHRLKVWAAHDMLFPHGSSIICSPGKLCRHTLQRTDQPARGRITSIPRR